MSTEDGICMFDQENEIFLAFDETDGVKGKEFQQGSSYRNSEGILFFGGANGYTAVDPTNIANNTFAPPVEITKLWIHYLETTPLLTGSPLKESIEETEHALA